MPMNAPFDALTAAISVYFDGLYNSDTGRLRQVFHEKALFACATDGDLLYRTMDEYFPIVDDRPSPASRGERRNDRIRSIEFAGPAAARACVNCSVGDRYFTDFLTFVFVDGRWQIISKVFHHEPLASAQDGAP